MSIFKNYFLEFVFGVLLLIGILDILLGDQFLGFLIIGIGLTFMFGKGVRGSNIDTGQGLVRRKNRSEDRSFPKQHKPKHETIFTSHLIDE